MKRLTEKERDAMWSKGLGLAAVAVLGDYFDAAKMFGTEKLGDIGADKLASWIQEEYEHETWSGSKNDVQASILLSEACS